MNYLNYLFHCQRIWKKKTSAVEMLEDGLGDKEIHLEHLQKRTEIIEEYLTRQYDSSRAQGVLSQFPNTVGNLDRLAKQYDSEAKEIIATKNFERIRELAQQAHNFIREEDKK